MRFAGLDPSRVTVDDDFFYDETHTFEPVHFLSVLPDRVVIDFVHSIDQADLEVIILYKKNDT